MQIKSDLGENLKRNINGKKIWNNCAYEIKTWNAHAPHVVVMNTLQSSIFVLW